MKRYINQATELKHTKVIVKKGDRGPAAEDIQRKLSKLGYLKDSNITAFYGDETAKAVMKFAEDSGLAPTEDVSEKVWAMLVDASFKLGDRNLFLRIPYFHGNDVLQLQKALGSLGFELNRYDGIFGTSTERAVRRFQVNMGLPSDGIVGSQTFMALKNLQFTWSDKEPISGDSEIEIKTVWRASEVLEKFSICLYGTDEFCRDVALRMSNLARATNPFSKILDSTAFSIAPDKNTLLMRIALPDEQDSSSIKAPRVMYLESASQEEDSDISDKISGNLIPDDDTTLLSFAKRLSTAMDAAYKMDTPRISIEIPSKHWWDAGADRSAQHYAITILDALCSVLQSKTNMKGKND